MDDPFFAEDDGEFDDFYGNGASKRPSHAAMPRPSEPQPVATSTIDALLPAYPDTPASSVASFMSKSTDGGPRTMTSAATTPHNSTHKKTKKLRRKRSQERFEVEWERDDDVTECFVCAKAFSLLKRKHHCRHCGRVICSDCSSFRRVGSSRGKHRVCSVCSVEIANGGGRQTMRGEASMSDAEAPTPHNHEYDQHGRTKLRQSMAGAVASKSADPRSHSNAVDATAGRSSRKSGTHSKEAASELFDTSDDAWFGDPVDDRNERNVKRGTQSKFPTTSRQRDSYARPPAVTAPDSLFDVQFTNHYGEDSDKDDRDEFAMPRPTSQTDAPKTVPHSRGHRASMHQSTVPRSDAPLTMEDLQSSSASASYVSSLGQYETPIVAVPTIKNTRADRTFYGDDADQLVVDEEPGFYDTMARGNKPKQTETPVYNNAAPIPEPSVLVADSDGSSGTLVEVPDSTNSRVPTPAGKDEDTSPNSKGFTGVLKRFFGISKPKRPSQSEQQKTDPAPEQTKSKTVQHQASLSNVDPVEQQITVEMPKPTMIAPAEFDHYDSIDQPESDATYDVMHTVTEEARNGYENRSVAVGTPLRHTMASYAVPTSRADNFLRASAVGAGVERENAFDLPIRHTMASYAVPSSHAESYLQASVTGASSDFQATSQLEERKKMRNSTRSRRDTFDDLFDMPGKTRKASLTAPASANLPTRAWTSPYDAPSSVGVDRFDRPRRDDEGDDIARGLGLPTDLGQTSIDLPPVSQTPQPSWSAVVSYRSSAPTMYASPDTFSTSRDSSNHSSGYQGYQPTDMVVESGTMKTPESGRGSERNRSIMDDIKPNSMSGNQTRAKQDSLDDYFAEFEKPTEYVFDTATGTYVSAVPERSRQFTNDRASNVTAQYSSSQKATERRETPRVPSRLPDALETVREDSSDEIDGVIADKISTLAGELEALKQLLRQRRVRSSPTSGGKPSTPSRKQSIFDSDGSDEDPQPRPKKSSKLERIQKVPNGEDVSATRTNHRKRKDSFAGLFEDEPQDDGDRTGYSSRNYEALFQIGQEGAKIDDPDESDAGETKVSGRRRKHGSKVAKQRNHLSSSESEDREVPNSRLHSASSIQLDTTTKTANQTEVPLRPRDGSGDQQFNMALVPGAYHSSLVKKKPKRDAIDSLFDSDSDQDMGQLYANSGTPSDITTNVRAKSEYETSFDVVGLAHDPEQRSRETNVGAEQPRAVQLDHQADAAQSVSSDEEFSSTLKNLRGRRKTSTKTVKSDEVVPSTDVPDLSGGFTAQSASIRVDSNEDVTGMRLSESQSSDSDVAPDGTSAVEENEQKADHSRSLIAVESALAAPMDASDDVAPPPAAMGTEDDFSPVHDDSVIAQAPVGSPVDRSSTIGSSSAVQFDPLALLDDDKETSSAPRNRRKDDVLAPVDSISTASALPPDPADIGERLKALRLRDDLFDDSSDALGPATSLNLDDLFSGPGTHSGELWDDNYEHRSQSEDEEGFSFEIKRKPRVNETTSPVVPESSTEFAVDNVVSANLDVEDRKASQRDVEPTMHDVNDEKAENNDALGTIDEEAQWGAMSIASSSGDTDIVPEADSMQFQDDWQRMQEQEKERKKRLQLKQRQAQREKLKKQSSSVRSLGKSGSTRGLGQPPSSPTNGELKKLSRSDKDAVDGSEHKKKKKHRRKAEAENADGEDTSVRTRKAEKRRHKHRSSTEPEITPPASSLTDL